MTFRVGILTRKRAAHVQSLCESRARRRGSVTICGIWKVKIHSVIPADSVPAVLGVLSLTW